MKNFLFLIFTFIFALPIFAQDESIVLPSQNAIVQEVEYIDIDENSITQVKQNVKLKLKGGKFSGEIIELDNMLTGNPYYDIALKSGMNVILHAEDNGNGIEYSIADIKRDNILGWLSLLFCILLVYVGKLKGVLSLVSIALTILLVVNFLSPLILLGINPVFATTIVCILSTLITMYLVGGFNAKSTSASLGTIFSIILAGILAFITIKVANLSGFTGENSMFLYTAHPQLDFIALAISTIILATLGAVMDVAMSIASTINEILTIDCNKTIKELFTSGMNVGKDIIGTMANTLILVYIGGSLPLLLLANNIDLQKFINLNQVVTEIAAALIGSIAIVTCVPITAIVASKLIKKLHKKDNNKQIEFDCV